MISAIKRLGGLSRRLKADNEGVAAVEFALLLPVMLTMYLGCVELSSGYSCLRKVDALARAMSDLTSQSPAAIDAAAMNEIVASSKGVMQPFDTTLARVAVSSIIVPNALPLKAYTDWSYTSGGGSPRPCGVQSPGVVPAGFMNGGRSAIVADVSYDYLPLLAGAFTSFGDNSKLKVTLSKTLWLQPRILNRVPISGIPGKCAGTPSFP